MTGVDYTRQRGYFDPAAHPTTRVTLVGCGGIGSPTALALAKLGIPNITLVDDDFVEPHNLPNQLFPLADNGMAKAPALREFIEDMSPVVADAHMARATRSGFDPYVDEEGAVCGSSPVPAGSRLSGIVVSALDSMHSRSELWQLVARNIHVPLLVDARIGGQNIVVYSVDPRNPSDIELYESTLHSDEEAVIAPCSMRSVIDVGFACAALITRVVRRSIAKEPYEKVIFYNHDSLRIS